MGFSRWLLSGLSDPHPQAAPEPPYDPDLEPAPLGDNIRRGEAAHRLLNDPTLAEAFKELREDLYAGWFASEPKDANLREQIYYEAHALEKVTRKLITYRSAAQLRARERAA